jgi:cell wall assembly regulator SMI1
MARDCAGLFAAPPTPLALNAGCSDADIEQAEARLGVAIPASLAACLQASNGFTDLAGRYSYGWDLATIVAENLRGLVGWRDTAGAIALGLWR